MAVQVPGPKVRCRTYETVLEPDGVSSLCNCGWASETTTTALVLHGDWLDHSGQRLRVS